MKRINQDIISQTSERAKQAERKRMNYNFHPQLDDAVQRMLNALEPETYIRPHRHVNPEKAEVFILLQGKMLAVEFDDYGQIQDSQILDAEKGNYGCEISAGVWHTLISLESGSVAFEIKQGPYDALSENDFAPWSPAEGEADCSKFIKDMIKICL